MAIATWQVFFDTLSGDKTAVAKIVTVKIEPDPPVKNSSITLSATFTLPSEAQLLLLLFYYYLSFTTALQKRVMVAVTITVTDCKKSR